MLAKLIEIKVAAGLSLANRLRDLGDVQELIRHLDLGLDISDRLDPSVRDKFVELWKGVKADRIEP
jgi:hypothetical protein